jgi:hypothetical protein
VDATGLHRALSRT